MSKVVESRETAGDGVIWRLIRRALLNVFARSCRRVLLPRPLHPSRSPRARWLSQDVNEFLAAMRQQADTLRPLAKLDRFQTSGNRLMVEFAVFTVAGYRAMLERGVDQAQAAALIADIGWDVYAWGLKVASLPFRLTSRDPEWRIKRTIRLLLYFPFSAPGKPGYSVEVNEEGRDILTIFTHCPPQTFVRGIVRSRGDLGDLEAFYQSWCSYDWPGADIIAGDNHIGHYERTKTLSRGDSACDMCWMAHAGHRQKPVF